MKSFKGIIIFILISCVGIFLLEKIYSKYQNQYDLIFKNIEIQKNDYTDVYIGNSHTIALKNYSTIENAKVLNIATPGQDPFKTYAILKKWLPLLPNVKRVYIGLDYEMVGQNLSHSGLPNDDRQLYKYTDTLYNYNLQNKLMALSSFFRANRDLSFIFSSKKIDTTVNCLPPPSQLNDANCKKRALEHSQIRFKNELVAENLKFISLIINIAAANNKKLFFFNPPKTSCFKAHSYKVNVDYAKTSLDSLFKANKIIYYDFYEDENFVDTDFLDFDHLNKAGTVKLVSKLNAIDK